MTIRWGVWITFFTRGTWRLNSAEHNAWKKVSYLLTYLLKDIACIPESEKRHDRMDWYSRLFHLFLFRNKGQSIFIKYISKISSLNSYCDSLMGDVVNWKPRKCRFPSLQGHLSLQLYILYLFWRGRRKAVFIASHHNKRGGWTCPTSECLRLLHLLPGYIKLHYGQISNGLFSSSVMEILL